MKLVLVVLLSVAAVTMAIPVLQLNVAECKMCEVAIRVDEDVARELTEEAFLYECQKEFPEAYGSAECKQFANNQLDAVIRKIESGAPPQKVCADIKLC